MKGVLVGVGGVARIRADIYRETVLNRHSKLLDLHKLFAYPELTPQAAQTFFDRLTPGDLKELHKDLNEPGIGSGRGFDEPERQSFYYVLAGKLRGDQMATLQEDADYSNAVAIGQAVGLKAPDAENKAFALAIAARKVNPKDGYLGNDQSGDALHIRARRDSATLDAALHMRENSAALGDTLAELPPTALQRTLAAGMGLDLTATAHTTMLVVTTRTLEASANSQHAAALLDATVSVPSPATRCRVLQAAGTVQEKLQAEVAPLAKLGFALEDVQKAFAPLNAAMDRLRGSLMPGYDCVPESAR